MFLTIAELRELTGKIQRNAQAVALRSMGIEHKLRPDGTCAVLRSLVEKSLGLSDSVRSKKPIEPHWGGI
jgi:histidyl-tRNA synthetase